MVSVWERMSPALDQTNNHRRKHRENLKKTSKHRERLNKRASTGVSTGKRSNRRASTGASIEAHSPQNVRRDAVRSVHLEI